MSFHKLFFLTLLSFSLFYFPCYSSLEPAKLNPETNQLIQKSLSQAFWQRTRIEVSAEKISNWKALQAENKAFYHFLTLFKTQPSIIIDHFYSLFFKETQEGSNSQENTLKIFQQITSLLEPFKKGQFQEVQQIIDENPSFTKADKIMMALYFIYYGEQNDKVFELLSVLRLSVNDSLSFKEINSSMIPLQLKDTNEIAFVLSHHLLAIKKPSVTKRLMEQDIDFNSKTATGDNILHSYFLLNQSSKSKERKQELKSLAVFLQMDSTKRLLVDTNLSGVFPIQFAFSYPNQELHFLVAQELIKLQIDPQALPSQSHMYFWEYLSRQTQSDSEKTGITYLNFQAFLQNLFNFFSLAQPGELGKELSMFFLQAHNSIMSAEKIRILFLHELLSNPTSAKKTALIIKAIINRDETLFKNLIDREDLKPEDFFSQINYKESNRIYLSTSPFLEAIRHSFAPVIEYLLKNFKMEALKQENRNKTALSHNLDPLSLAFLTYGALDSKDPRKKSAQKIMHLILNNLTKFEPYNFPLFFSPIDWALFLGMKKEAQFLHESKNIDLPSHVGLKINETLWVLEWKDYLEEQGFEHLSEYLFNKELKENSDENIEETLERISLEALEKTRQRFFNKSDIKENLPEKNLEEPLSSKCKKHFLN